MALINSFFPFYLHLFLLFYRFIAIFRALSVDVQLRFCIEFLTE